MHCSGSTTETTGNEQYRDGILFAILFCCAPQPFVRRRRSGKRFGFFFLWESEDGRILELDEKCALSHYHHRQRNCRLPSDGGRGKKKEVFIEAHRARFSFPKVHPFPDRIKSAATQVVRRIETGDKGGKNSLHSIRTRGNYSETNLKDSKKVR